MHLATVLSLGLVLLASLSLNVWADTEKGAVIEITQHLPNSKQLEQCEEQDMVEALDVSLKEAHKDEKVKKGSVETFGDVVLKIKEGEVITISGHDQQQGASAATVVLIKEVKGEEAAVAHHKGVSEKFADEHMDKTFTEGDKKFIHPAHKAEIEKKKTEKKEGEPEVTQKDFSASLNEIIQKCSALKYSRDIYNDRALEELIEVNIGHHLKKSSEDATKGFLLVEPIIKKDFALSKKVSKAVVHAVSIVLYGHNATLLQKPVHWFRKYVMSPVRSMGWFKGHAQEAESANESNNNSETVEDPSKKNNTEGQPDNTVNSQ